MTSSVTSILGGAPGVGWKTPCVVSTTGNITLSGEQTIDGVSVVAGDRVLVKNQTDGTEDGIYVAATGAWSRAKDMDQKADIKNGAVVNVEGGSADAGIYEITFSGDYDPGTTNPTFTKIFIPTAANALLDSNNLSDVNNAATALSNLGGLAASSNLSDLGNVATARSNLGLTGKQTYPIPAAALQPTVSNGCSPLQSHEVSANQPDLQYLAFSNTTKQFAQIMVPGIKAMDVESGTLSARVWWTHNVGAVTTGVVWEVRAVALGDGDNFATNFGTAIEIEDNAQGATEEVNRTAESGAITPGGAWAEGDILCIRVARDVGEASDTMAGEAWLVALELFFTTDAVTDD